MTHVADDITCRAPGLDLSGRAAYREFIAGFAPALTGIASFTEGDHVALFYYPETQGTAGGGRVHLAERVRALLAGEAPAGEVSMLAAEPSSSQGG